MSTTAIAPPTGDFDDFRRWQAEIDTDQVEQLTGRKLPDHPSRAAQQRQAATEIAEGLADWHRTHERRN